RVAKNVKRTGAVFDPICREGGQSEQHEDQRPPDHPASISCFYPRIARIKAADSPDKKRYAGRLEQEANAELRLERRSELRVVGIIQAIRPLQAHKSRVDGDYRAIYVAYSQAIYRIGIVDIRGPYDDVVEVEQVKHLRGKLNRILLAELDVLH